MHISQWNTLSHNPIAIYTKTVHLNVLKMIQFIDLFRNEITIFWRADWKLIVLFLFFWYQIIIIIF